MTLLNVSLRESLERAQVLFGSVDKFTFNVGVYAPTGLVFLGQPRAFSALSANPRVRKRKEERKRERGEAKD